MMVYCGLPLRAQTKYNLALEIYRPHTALSVPYECSCASRTSWKTKRSREALLSHRKYGS